jgi:hypothetical protein
MQTGMSFEDAVNLAAEDMAGRPLKRSFDINTRMNQWDAAGRAQHTEDTERVLKGGSPRGDFIGRSDILKLRKMMLDMYKGMYPDTWSDEWVLQDLRDKGVLGPAFGGEGLDYELDSDVEQAYSAKDMIPAILGSKADAEERTNQDVEHNMYATDPNSWAKDPVDPMNRIGANKPRSVVLGEYFYPEPDGEGGWTTESDIEDFTEARDAPGPTRLAQAAIDDLLDSETIYEGE